MRGQGLLVIVARAVFLLDLGAILLGDSGLCELRGGRRGCLGHALLLPGDEFVECGRQQPEGADDAAHATDSAPALDEESDRIGRLTHGGASGSRP